MMLDREWVELLKDGKVGLTCAAGDATSLAEPELQLVNISTITSPSNLTDMGEHCITVA